MTEQEFLNCKEPDAILEHVRHVATDRQLRLFLCACCRRLLPVLAKRRDGSRAVCEKAIAAGEAHVDGDLSHSDLVRTLTTKDYLSVKAGPAVLAYEVARRITHAEMADSPRPMRFGRRICGHPVSEGAEFARQVEGVILRDALWKEDRALAVKKKRAATIREKQMQIQFLVDLFGYLFHTKRPASEVAMQRKRWARFLKEHPAVAKLARTIYAGHEFTRFGELADVLEKAGCPETQIVSHFREEKVHIRGCWALEYVLHTASLA